MVGRSAPHKPAVDQEETVSLTTTSLYSWDRDLLTTHLIGARIGHVDNSSCLFGLQVGDERAL